MIPLDFVSAKLKHATWRSKMRSFLDGEQIFLSEAEAVSHQDCELGKWLYSEGIAKYGRIPELQELERVHEKLHSCVRDIIRMKNSDNTSGAEKAYKELDMASERIFNLLDQLDNKVVANSKNQYGQVLKFPHNKDN